MNIQVVGIDEKWMDEFFDDQDMSMWCWAACLEGIFKYGGVDLEQQNFVRREFGRLVNKGGGNGAILRAANFQGVDNSSHDFWSRAKRYDYIPTSSDVYRILKNNRPVMLELVTGRDARGYITSSHGVLITSMTYHETLQGPYIHNMILRDPAADTSFEYTKGRKNVVPYQILKYIIRFWDINVGIGY